MKSLLRCFEKFWDLKLEKMIELKNIDWDHKRLALEIWEEEEPIASCEISIRRVAGKSKGSSGADVRLSSSRHNHDEE